MVEGRNAIARGRKMGKEDSLKYVNGVKGRQLDIDCRKMKRKIEDI